MIGPAEHPLRIKSFAAAAPPGYWRADPAQAATPNSEEFAMTRNLEETIVGNMQSGYLCSESVLKGAAEHQGLTWDRLPAIATGLGAGIGGTAHVCGALTGGAMALGLAHGRNTPEEDFFACLGLTQELVEGFEKRFGSINCLDVLGLDLRTEEGRNAYLATGFPNLPCRDCLSFVARHLAENLPAAR
jgi:C_GCAxxG_C_C family probable redox protein